MEQNLIIITKKIWKTIRVLYFMLRKGVSKAKLWADLTTVMKRGKIAGKAAFHNLVFHRQHHASSSGGRAGEYEFSFVDSPIIFCNSASRVRRSSGGTPHLDSRVLAAALEIISSAGASPALPGFGPSPLVKQLRITDSPFPIRDPEEESQVDAAAEEFITKFYKDLKRQNSMAYLGYY